LSYDVLSFNTGSYVPLGQIAVQDQEVFLAKPIERLIEARQHIITMGARRPITVGIVGGGPSAAEIAGNLLHLARCQGLPALTVTIYAGRRFMDRFPAPVRRRIMRCLRRRGVSIRENAYVESVRKGEVHLRSGKGGAADIVFLAQGVVPSPIFAASGLPTGPDGGLRVNRYLQSTVYPDLFGGGDCIYFEDHPLDKVGVYAVRENPILYHNLKATLMQAPLQPFDPGGDYLLIFNLGEGQGVLHKRWLTFGGRAAFVVKDVIDRRFMKKFQALE
jgi:NADH dehydrogenase FAD-containing subunit